MVVAVATANAIGHNQARICQARIRVASAVLAFTQTTHTLDRIADVVDTNTVNAGELPPTEVFNGVFLMHLQKAAMFE